MAIAPGRVRDGLDLTDAGETVLVEVNDAYALGCYGLASHLYAPMLIERWREMVHMGRSF